MVKRKNDNLRTKRKFLVWLREAKGLSESSIDKAAASIDHYLTWLKKGDLRQFNTEKAIAFKRNFASERMASGKPRSITTISNVLRDLQGFMHWLADQPGYRSRIRHSDADYFSPDRKSDQARRGQLWKPHPSAAQISHTIRMMPTNTIFQRRDKAIMAFLLLTGARLKATMTVRLGHVDLVNACVHFDGRLVETKFGKRFTVGFYPVDKDCIRTLNDWISELSEQHLWGTSDALFPRALVGIDTTGRFNTIGLDRSPWRSPSRIVKIVKDAFCSVGLPPYSPHSVRKAIVELANEHCHTPEEFKAWSQNLGHEEVLTTFMNYGTLSPGRQMELIGRMRDSVGPKVSEQEFH